MSEGGTGTQAESANVYRTEQVLLAIQAVFDVQAIAVEMAVGIGDKEIDLERSACLERRSPPWV